MRLPELKFMKNKTLFSRLFWIASVSKRFSRVDRKGRSAVTSALATLGIGFGVMTLIVVMSVMNGFQMSFIDSILEISSYHVRAVEVPAENEKSLLEFCQQNKRIKSCSPFYEAQALMTGRKGGANSVILRAVEPDCIEKDSGMKKELTMVLGSFNLEEKDSIVLGSSLARKLGVGIGDEVNLLVMSGGSDVELFSQDRLFTVSGIFSCGYAEINNGFGFVSIDAAKEYFGSGAKKQWGIKLKNYTDDMIVCGGIEKLLPGVKINSWREYNKTFFGALRIEKNMLLLLVALIFVVVAINIFNGMRRLVFERKSEIAILSALGARAGEIKLIFIVRGFITGAVGAVFGLIFGLLISCNTDVVFMAASKVMYWIQYCFTAITNHNNLAFVQENSTYRLYASIPARIFPGEVVMISLFGVFAPLIATWAASKNVLKMTISEVLHNE